MSETNRRAVIKALGVVTAGGVAEQVWGEDLPLAHAAHTHKEEQATNAAGPSHAKFFQGREFKTVQRLTDLILPSDGTPGARDAGVAEFLDFYLAGSPVAAQKNFREGLVWLDRRSGKPFADLPETEQVALLTSISQKNADAAGAAFFQLVRRLTVFGFYTSKVGVKELGYLGNSYAAEFPGACTHPQHEL